MRYLSDAVYLAMAVVALRRWRSTRGRPEALAAALFVLTAGVSLAGILLPRETGDGLVLLLQRLNVCAVLGFPMLLFGIGAHFERGRGLRWASAATAALVVATLLVPVPADDTKPWWLTVYSLLFFGQWAVLSIATATRLWRAGTSQPAIARRRMRMMAIGASLVTGCIFLSVLGLTRQGPGAQMVQQGLTLVSMTILWFGISPGPIMRMLWRRKEERAVHEAELDLLTATTPGEVMRRLLPPAARLVGASWARFVGNDGRVLGSTGPIEPDDEPTMVINLAVGRLELSASEYVPYFGDEELSLLHALGAVVDLALARCETIVEQQEAVRRLAESEAQLAQAQSIAKIGSFSWDRSGGDVEWSAEMHRILGFEPGEVTDHGRAFASRIHPDDQGMVFAMWQEARAVGRTEPIDYRIVLPDGSVRWVQGRSEIVVAADGVGRVLGTIQDITDRKASEDAVAFRALHDELTGLPNRALFTDRLERALSRRSADSVVTVLFLDIDRFKWVNDSLGHAAGDDLLVEVSRRLSATARVGDTVARLGGDEFMVLCDGVRSEEETEAVAQRFADAIRQPFEIDGAELIPTVSIGIATAPPGAAADVEMIVANADAAMYRAKELGRNRCERYDQELRSRAVARFGMESALRRSIENRDLQVHYQPEVDLATGDVVGLEALVRWEHPDRGPVPPSEFIPLAEETGLIVPLGRLVLDQACAFTAHLQRLHARPLHVAVNLSGRQLLSPGVAADVTAALAAAGLDPESLRLEITETVLLDDGDLVGQALASLKALGVQLAVDDFGTGYSSLTYLKRFPVDVLKIDRSFVEGLGQDCEDDAIVAGVIDLAHAFALTTVGEGVERLDQLHHLRTLGCENGQGYFWSRALPPEELELWIGGQGAGITAEPPRTSGRRILIVEDDARLRRLLRTVFDDDERYDVVAEAGDGRQAIALARRHHPDVVLLDLAMPGMGGLQALPLLRAVAPGSTIAVLSGVDEVEIQDRARRLGADTWLTKGDDPTLIPSRLTGLVRSL